MTGTTSPTASRGTSDTAPAAAPPIRHGAPWRRIRPVWYGIVVIAALTALFTTGAPLQTYLFTFNACLLAVFGAVALNLLLGTAGLVSIGNSAFLAVGAFGALIVSRWDIPFPLDIVAGGLIAGAIGVVIGLPALRLRGLYLALATLSAFFIVDYFANQYQRSAPGGGDGGFVLSPTYQSKGLVGAQQYWAWTLFILVAVLLLVMGRLVGERSGRAWRMIRDHETAAHALGIRVVRYKLLAFALSSAIIGVQGALAMHLTGSLSSDQFTLELAISYIAMVLIGGLDSIAGAVIGAVIVTALPIITPKILTYVIGSQQATAHGAAIAESIYGLLVIILVSSSSRGLVGAWHNLWRSTFARPLRRWLTDRVHPRPGMTPDHTVAQ
jgi:branched-chain amino acid transport system permease protein